MARPSPGCAAFAASPAPHLRSRVGNFSARSGPLSRRRPQHVTATASDGKAVTVKFEPEGVSVAAEVGEPLANVAKRGKVDLLITCGEGDCGSCEIEQVFLDGEKRIIRPCCMPVVEAEAGADDTVTYLTYPDFNF